MDMNSFTIFLLKVPTEASLSPSCHSSLQTDLDDKQTSNHSKQEGSWQEIHRWETNPQLREFPVNSAASTPGWGDVWSHMCISWSMPLIRHVSRLLLHHLLGTLFVWSFEKQWCHWNKAKLIDGFKFIPSWFFWALVCGGRRSFKTPKQTNKQTLLPPGCTSEVAPSPTCQKLSIRCRRRDQTLPAAPLAPSSFIKTYTTPNDFLTSLNETMLIIFPSAHQAPSQLNQSLQRLWLPVGSGRRRMGGASGAERFRTRGWLLFETGARWSIRQSNKAKTRRRRWSPKTWINSGSRQATEGQDRRFLSAGAQTEASLRLLEPKRGEVHLLIQTCR